MFQKEVQKNYKSPEEKTSGDKMVDTVALLQGCRIEEGKTLYSAAQKEGLDLLFKVKGG